MQNADIVVDHMYLKRLIMLQAKNGAIRDETLMKLTTPIMFVQVKQK